MVHRESLAWNAADGASSTLLVETFLVSLNRDPHVSGDVVDTVVLSGALSAPSVDDGLARPAVAAPSKGDLDPSLRRSTAPAG